MPFVVATLDSFTQNAARSQTAGGVVKSASADIVTLTAPSSTVRRSSVTDFSAPPLTASVPAPVLYSVDWLPSTTLSTLLTAPSGTSTTPRCLYPTAIPPPQAASASPPEIPIAVTRMKSFLIVCFLQSYEKSVAPIMPNLRFRHKG